MQMPKFPTLLTFLLLASLLIMPSATPLFSADGQADQAVSASVPKGKPGQGHKRGLGRRHAANDNIRTVSMDVILKSLPAEPISVGFDVDDTILFSSPGFFYAFNNADGPKGANKYGEKPLASDQFWKDMSCFHDKYSMPKESARRLLEMHQKRNDKIYFITARPPVKGEILTETLNRLFKLDNKHPVIFSGKTSKAEFIKANSIKVFYGDSDSDITEAMDAGIRAIRVERSNISTNKGKYHPGKYGEWVLINSAE